MAHNLSGPWLRLSGADGLNEMRREIDSLFNRLSLNSLGAPESVGVFPPVNLSETDAHYILSAEIPGLEADAITARIEGSIVSLQGERKAGPFSEEKSSWHRKERPSGAFRRAFELPVAIDSDAAEATYKDGLLTLVLPKPQERQPRQVPVRDERGNNNG